MESVSVSVTNPELQVEDFFLEKCFLAMEVDSLSSSHPVSTPVENPAQIQEMFDSVLYDKAMNHFFIQFGTVLQEYGLGGACILNMLRDFLTPEAFKIGIVHYLRRYSWKNTVNSHLWDSLTNIRQSDELDGVRVQRDGFCSTDSQTAASKWYAEEKLDVQAMMVTWTLQEGFPVVCVEVRGREVRLTQERFLKSEDSSKGSGYLWHIPLIFITSNSSTIHRFLLATKTGKLYRGI